MSASDKVPSEGTEVFPFSVEDVARLNAEWDALQELVASSRENRDPDAMRKATRWVIVHAFGDWAKFHFDPVFHARCVAAEQMLERLRRGRVDRE